MNAAVCKKEFDEIKGLISNGEISQSLDRLKELLECGLLPKILPTCVNADILQRLNTRKLQFISHLSRGVLAMTAKPSVELAEIERGTNCLINFIAHVGNLDAKDIRDLMCNITVRLYKLADGNGHSRLALKLSGLFVLLTDQQNLKTAWACWKSVKLRTTAELEKFTRNYSILNVIEECHLGLSEPNIYDWLNNEYLLYRPQQLYFMEDSVTVLLNILQLKISPVLLAEAYVNLGEILLHSAEELINYEACCAHLEKESNLCVTSCDKGLALLEQNDSSFTANFVRSKLFLLRFLTMTAKKAEGSVEAKQSDTIRTIDSTNKEKVNTPDLQGARFSWFSTCLAQLDESIASWELCAKSPRTEISEDFNEFSLRLARICTTIPKTETTIFILIWSVLNDAASHEVFTILGYELLRLNEVAGLWAVVHRFAELARVAGSLRPAQQPLDQYFRCQMDCLEALTLCGSGKGAEAKKLLESVRDHDLVKQKKSRQAFIISACVCHVESVASHAFPDYFGSQNTLERLYERCRFLRAAVESSIGKKSWEWDKGGWTIALFFRSLEDLSLAYLRAGLPLEAAVYVKEGLTLARKLHFLLWEVLFLSLQLEIESLCGKLDDVVVTLRQLECNFNSGLNVPSKKMTTGRTKRNKPQLEPLDEGTVQRQVENLRQCQSNSDDYEIISKVVSRADSFEETFSFQWFMSMLKDRCSKYDCLLANVIKVIGCCRSLLEDHSESGKIFNGTEVKSVFDVALKVNDKLMSVCHERMRKIVAPLVEKFGRSGDSTSLSLATKWNSANCRLISAQLKVLRTNQKWTELKQVAKRALIQFSESQLEMELSHFNSLWRLYEFIGYCKEHLCLSQIEESSLIDSLSKITIRGKQKMEVKLIPNKGSKNRKHLIEIQNSESSASVDLKKDLEQQEKFSRTLIKKGQNLLDTICSGNYNIQRQLQEILIMLSLSRGGHQECFPLITGAIGMGFRNQFAYAAALKSERAKLENESCTDVENLPTFTSFKDIREGLSSLPSSWTILHLLQTTTAAGFSQIVAARFSRDKEPLIVSLPSSSTHQTYLKQLKLLVESASASVKEKDKKVFWDTRKSLDTQLKDLLNCIERDWFGPWKGLLLGNLDVPSKYDCLTRLESIAESHRLPLSKEQCELLMDSSLVLNSEELTALIGAVLSFDSTVIKAVLKVTEIYKVASSFEDSTARSPVILVLDKALVSVPWESLPIMEEQLVSRIPCMHLIPHLLKIWHKKRLIHHRRLFYLLNPGGDLPETQKRLEGWFQQEETSGWTGIIGRSPDLPEIHERLTGKDVYIYAGHGSGSAYLPLKELRKFGSPPSVFLMGCSSGRPVSMGCAFDSTAATVEAYLFSKSISVVANLWDVTDRDIDHFLVSTFHLWVAKEPLAEIKRKPIASKILTKTKDLLTAICQSRRTCKLRYLNGAAPVIYGLPVYSDLNSVS